MAPIPSTSGIYKITCTVTGKFYIGSATDLCHRCAQHLYALRNNQHHNPKLQAAWNKYGPDAFLFEVLEVVLPIFLLEREQYWFDRLKPFGKKGFNINREADRPLNTPETCERIRLAKLGHTVSDETRALISASKMGHQPDPAIYDARRKALIVTAPDGTEYTVLGIGKFCKEHGLDTSSLMRVAKGFDRGTVCIQHKGWKARFLGTEPQEIKHQEISPEARSNRAEAQKKTLIVTDPNGVEYIVHGISQFAKRHNLDRYHLVAVAQGKRHYHKGWKARFPD